MKRYFGVDFNVVKFDGLDGKTIVAYQENSGESEPFEVRVSRSGMTFKGKLSSEICTENDLQDFAKMIADIWQEHRKLAPKLNQTLAGH